MNEIFDLFVKWFVPFLCGTAVAVITNGVAHRKKNKAKEQSLEDGVQCLLRAEIIRSYEKYNERGWCPIYAKESLKRGYKAYHTLGGNDVATELYNKILIMPETAKEEEK